MKLAQIRRTSRKLKRQLTLRQEKITIIDGEKIYLENYPDLIEITDDALVLKNLTIQGKDLKVARISKYFVVIEGKIQRLEYGERHE